MESGSAYGNFTGEADTLTCAARNIQDPIPYLSVLATVIRVSQGVFFLLLVIAGTFLNGMVLVLVAKYKKLQTLSFLVSLQVTVLDLVLSVPLLNSVVTAFANQWLLGEYPCGIAGCLASFITLTRTLLMCVFVVDRFLAVSFPYAYPKHKLKVTVSLSIASWVFAVVVCVAMLPGLLDCYTFAPGIKLCVVSSQCNYPCSIYVRFYGAILFPASGLPAILYAVLYCKARKIRKAMNMDSAAGKAYQSEWKATITFSLLFITVFVLILPTTAVTLITVALTGGSSGSYEAYCVLTVNSSLVSCFGVTDPIVIMRDKDVREILSRIKAAFVDKRSIQPSKPINTVTTEL